MKSAIECDPKGVIKVFNQIESLDIEKQWMDIFCKNKHGFNTKAFKWHIFSGNGYPSVDAAQARNEYESRTEAEYIVMGNESESAILTKEKPQSCNIRDYYVFPPNMAWTMAFTHEEGWLGPYFAYHPNYKTLNIENEKRLEKKRQKEIAKQRGWQ